MQSRGSDVLSRVNGPPELIASPASALVDEPFAVSAQGFAPESQVLFTAELTDDAGHVWSAAATYRADAAGALDLTRDAALPGGSYEGIEPMGLVWSLQSNDDGAANPMLFRRRLDPLALHIAARGDGAAAAVTVERRSIAAGVRRTEVRERGLVGVLFEPPGAPAATVITLNGSGGGLSEPLAALFASHGIAALALGYFAMPGLPDELKEIPLEYFETAMQWLAERPSVRAQRVGVVGASRGGELALLLGATFPRVAAVVSYAPSALVYGGFGRRDVGVSPAWLYRGESVPWFRPTQRPSPMAPPPPGPIALTPGFEAGLKDEDAVARSLIPVERIAGPVMLVSGDADLMWPSSTYAAMVMRRLQLHGHAYADRHLHYPDAGHTLNFPFVPCTVNASRHPISGQVFAYGGTARGQARAREDSWPKVLTFLRDALG